MHSHCCPPITTSVRDRTAHINRLTRQNPKRYTRCGRNYSDVSRASTAGASRAATTDMLSPALLIELGPVGDAAEVDDNTSTGPLLADELATTPVAVETDDGTVDAEEGETEDDDGLAVLLGLALEDDGLELTLTTPLLEEDDEEEVGAAALTLVHDTVA